MACLIKWLLIATMSHVATYGYVVLPDDHYLALVKHHKIGPCEPNPCVFGECHSVDDHSFRCDCFGSFQGNNCETLDPCHSKPCQNGGLCEVVDGKAHCTCNGNWLQPICKECNCPKSSEPGHVPDSYCNGDGKCVCHQIHNTQNNIWIFDESSRACREVPPQPPPTVHLDPSPPIPTMQTTT
uniref:EGF-like domain-containing protein n=1 Tax=Clytia hemisphaerica TaxID=252671 RepID=A0A7M5VD03_9CNID